MASILERCRDILESNVHALLDKCEDKEKMLDQNLRKAMRDLAEVRDATASVMADERAAQRNYDDAVAAADSEHACAANALRAGDEAAAREFLASEQKIRTTRVAQAEAALNAARVNSQKMKDAHNKLVDDIDWMQSQMNTIKGTLKVAKVTDKVSKVKGIKNDSAATFTRYGEEAQRMLDEAQARAELAEKPADSLDGLRAKYGSGGAGTADTDDALAALRNELNGGNT